jgi:hypothetical protein
MEKRRLLIHQEEEEAHRPILQSVQRTWQENVKVFICSACHVGIRLCTSQPKCLKFETKNMAFPSLQGKEIYQH